MHQKAYNLIRKLDTKIKTQNAKIASGNLIIMARIRRRTSFTHNDYYRPFSLYFPPFSLTLIKFHNGQKSMKFHQETSYGNLIRKPHNGYKKNIEFQKKISYENCTAKGIKSHKEIIKSHKKISRRPKSIKYFKNLIRKSPFVTNHLLCYNGPWKYTQSPTLFNTTTTS
jgi:hypothetical protein